MGFWWVKRILAISLSVAVSTGKTGNRKVKPTRTKVFIRPSYSDLCFSSENIFPITPFICWLLEIIYGTFQIETTLIVVSILRVGPNIRICCGSGSTNSSILPLAFSGETKPIFIFSIIFTNNIILK